MYATFDRNSPSSLSADVTCLSWKGDGSQGWLASGNSRKTVGVTYTELRDEDDFRCGDVFYDVHDISLERQGMRRNFNFREHSEAVGKARQTVWYRVFVCVCGTGNLCTVAYILVSVWENRPASLPRTYVTVHFPGELAPRILPRSYTRSLGVLVGGRQLTPRCAQHINRALGII